jgi:hypothetical protein
MPLARCLALKATLSCGGVFRFGLPPRIVLVRKQAAAEGDRDMDTRQQPSTQKTDPLQAWLAALRLGEPLSDRALALVPVYADGGHRTLRYRTLGEVIVSEAAQAAVPTLQLINKGELPVLILDGEEMVGGRQNRVVNTTLLVPARSAFDLPVSCVEHGRWHELRPMFDAGETAYPRLRSQKLYASLSRCKSGTGRVILCCLTASAGPAPPPTWGRAGAG